MFIYNGKFNWTAGKTVASNETITIVFPVGFALNDPVSGFWQWSTDALVNEKASVSSIGVVNSVTAAAKGYRRIHFSFGHYTFDATISADNNTHIVLKMRDQDRNSSEPFSLDVMHADASKTTCTVYTGTLEFLSFAKTEMVTLVVPDGIKKGAFFGLYHQWTIDPKDSKKENHRVNGTFERVKANSDGSITASFEDEEFLYEFKFSGTGGLLSVSGGPEGRKSDGNKLTLTYKV